MLYPLKGRSDEVSNRGERNTTSTPTNRRPAAAAEEKGGKSVNTHERSDNDDLMEI